MMKRRDALKTIGGLASAAGIARYVPGCGGGDDGPTGITTYVYMMMENRSYDHLFGARSMLEGKPGDGLTATMRSADINGQLVAPWHPTINQQCDLDPPHGWDAAHLAFNGGANDGFLKVHQQEHGNNATAVEPLQYLTREDVPVSWALADQYATCDRWFCSVMGPTWPNRFYWMTGSSGGLVNNMLPEGGMLGWPSIFNRLEDSKVDWAYYYGSIPVLSALNNPGPYQLEKDYVQTRVKAFAKFMTDAAAGTLPPVVYIDPYFYGNDDHPPIHPLNGQELIAAVYTALAQSPQWKNCMLVITYDENGGFFDHVAPPKTTDERAAEGFDQMGFRVPAMVIGPYVKEGHVSSVVYDHASALKHLETTFGLEPLNVRTMAANDLSDCIDLDRLARGDWKPPIELPTVVAGEWADVRLHPECGQMASGLHPVIDWADAHPEMIAGLDRRDEQPEYRKAIQQFLASHPRIPVR